MSRALVPGNRRVPSGQAQQAQSAPSPEVVFGRFGVASPERLRLEREVASEPLLRSRRRRWPWVLLALALAGGIGAGAFFAGRLTKPAPPAPPPPPATAAVLGLSQPLTEGQAIGPADLKVITIVTGSGVTGAGAGKGARPASHPLPYFSASAEAGLVGRRVRSALPAGALLTPGELANAPFPAKGQTLVGLDLTPSESPSGSALVPGDHVGVLYVPAAAQPPYPAPRPFISAQVVGSVPGQTGDSYVTILVPSSVAAQLAAYAQHGEVALVRLGPGVVWPPPAPPPSAPATAKVLALAQPLNEGQAIWRGDLKVITIVTGPAGKSAQRPPHPLPYFRASAVTSLLGRHVRSALPAGALLTPGELANAPFPAKGQALVGLDLTPSEAPSGSALLPGDHVGVLYVPAASQPPYPAPSPLVTGQVVSSVAGQTGDSYVTILVPSRFAARLAAYAQHDEVALVRLGPGVAWPPAGTGSSGPGSSGTGSSRTGSPSTAAAGNGSPKATPASTTPASTGPSTRRPENYGR